jgi:hypothetical protein
MSEGYACLTGYCFLAGYLFGSVSGLFRTASGLLGFSADWLLEPIRLSAGMESYQKEKFIFVK